MTLQSPLPGVQFGNYVVWEYRPSWILTAENQKKVITELTTSNITLDLELKPKGDLLISHQLEQKFVQLNDDYQYWSDRAAKVCDGQGARRVADAIIELYPET